MLRISEVVLRTRHRCDFPEHPHILREELLKQNCLHGTAARRPGCDSPQCGSNLTRKRELQMVPEVALGAKG